MTLEEIAEVRPRLVDFTAEMLGGLARKDQRAAGKLYVRGLLTGGQRKSMEPMAARLGIDHQRLQQFITSSTWDYVAVRRNVARWFAASRVRAHGRAGRAAGRAATIDGQTLSAAAP
jgi:SRSO17 transposase